MSRALLIFSLLTLVLTKLADLWTTVRHVGPQGESNPMARAFFSRLGFAGGLLAVMAIWASIVFLVVFEAWDSPEWCQLITAGTGLFVSWVQWKVARFNATGRSCRTTRIAALIYSRWAGYLPARAPRSRKPEVAKRG